MASGCTRMHGLASQQAALRFWQLSSAVQPGRSHTSWLAEWPCTHLGVGVSVSVGEGVGVDVGVDVGDSVGAGVGVDVGAGVGLQTERYIDLRADSCIPVAAA